MKFANPCRNEHGAVLVIGLIFMAILSILGTSAYLTTSNELKLSSNYRTAKAALYAAEAGIQEARERLRGTSSISDNADYVGDPATNPDATWSAYILTSSTWTTSDDPNYDSNYQNYIPTTTSHTATTVTANSLQSNISYWVKIRHKREADILTGETYTDGGGTSNDIVYYGYRTASSTTLEEFTTTVANPANARPIEIVRAYGSSGGSAKIVEVHVRRTIGPPIVGALYGDSVGGNGNVTVTGDDNCNPPSSSVPAVAYATAETLSGGGSVSLTSTARATSDIGSALNITQYVDALQSQATVVLIGDQQNYDLGSPTDYQIVYCDATVLAPDQELDLKNIGQVSGAYGTLVVRGDVDFGGNISWNGLIIVDGNCNFSGGGTETIYGAIMANSTATLQGSRSFSESGAWF